MLSKIAQNAAYFFVEKNFVKKEDEKIFAYGCEIFLSEGINWLITIIIAIATRSIAETALYMIAFVQTRESIGGFHAKTHLGCIVISTVVYVICLFLIYSTPQNFYWSIMVGILLLHNGAVFKIAPIEHPNKPFSDNEKIRFRKKGRFLSSIYSGISILLMIVPLEICQRLSYSILLGLISASVSMVAEYMIQKTKKYNISEKGGYTDEKV